MLNTTGQSDHYCTFKEAKKERNIFSLNLRQKVLFIFMLTRDKKASSDDIHPRKLQQFKKYALCLRLILRTKLVTFESEKYFRNEVVEIVKGFINSYFFKVPNFRLPLLSLFYLQTRFGCKKISTTLQIFTLLFRIRRDTNLRT